MNKLIYNFEKKKREKKRINLVHNYYQLLLKNIKFIKFQWKTEHPTQVHILLY